MIQKKLRINVIDDINEEIILYLKDQHYESDLTFLKKNNFPYLHRLAVKILSIPTSSAPSERVLSRSEIFMRPHRSRYQKRCFHN